MVNGNKRLITHKSGKPTAVKGEVVRSDQQTSAGVWALVCPTLTKKKLKTQSNMKVTSEKEISLYDFDAWSGGRDTLDELTSDQCDTIEQYLEDLYPDGIDETQLNDFLWFERDTIAEWLGYSSFEALMKGEDDEEIEGELNGGDYTLSNGAAVTFTEWNGKFMGESEDVNGDTIESYMYPYDGDIDELAQRIIKDLEAQVNPEDIEGCKGVGLVSALQARFDSRASFYGKAQIDDHDDHITLYSYDTEVARYDKVADVLEVFGYYSATTARHIREFARQLGFTLPKGSDIEGIYRH